MRWLFVVIAMPILAQDVCRSGADAAQRQDFASARKLLSECLKLPGATAESYVLLARAYQVAGEMDDVLRTVTTGAKKFPEDKRFVLTAASIAGRKKQYAEAVKLLQPAIDRWPEDEKVRGLLASAHYGRGTELLDAGDSRGAAVSLGEAVHLTPNDVEAQMNLGRALHNLQRYREALHAFEKVAQIQPAFPLALFHRGMSYYAVGEPEKAITDLNQQIEATPDYPPAHLVRGLAHLANGHTEQALHDLSIAAAGMPDDASAQLAYARTLVQAGNLAEAEPKLRRAMQLDATDPAPVNALVTVLTRMDRTEEAKALAATAAELARRKRTANPGEIRFETPGRPPK
jgi:Flp pilus assembly protein TadD